MIDFGVLTGVATVLFCLFVVLRTLAMLRGSDREMRRRRKARRVRNVLESIRAGTVLAYDVLRIGR